jgi:CRISPR-associated protein Cmr3
MAAARTATMKKVCWCGLRLDPCDLLFFRDGRPFPSASHGESGLPTPQTLAGAIRTHLLEQAGCDSAGFRDLGRMLATGKDFASAAEKTCGAGWIAHVQVRGPWLCRGGGDAQPVADVFTAAPATLHQPKGPMKQDRPLLRLDPLDKRTHLPGWNAPLPAMRPLWSKEHGATERRSGYLTSRGLQAFLEGGVPEWSDDHLLPEGEIFAFDRRSGISVAAQRRTAETASIYNASFLALKPGMAFYAEVALPSASPSTTFADQNALRFGGEGRRVLVQKVEPFHWPAATPHSGQGTLVLLTTPGLFALARPDQAWKPSCFDDRSRLVAAAVAGSLPVSGWNLATGGPKPTRFAVPAGSVYFLEGDAEFLSGECLADSPEDRVQGWGCFARGVWNDV